MARSSRSYGAAIVYSYEGVIESVVASLLVSVRYGALPTSDHYGMELLGKIGMERTDVRSH